MQRGLNHAKCRVGIAQSIDFVFERAVAPPQHGHSTSGPLQEDVIVLCDLAGPNGRPQHGLQGGLP